jgi:hypothetical protein
MDQRHPGAPRPPRANHYPDRQGLCPSRHSIQEVGLIERAIGHQVPVLIHELESYEQIARQTEAANLPGLAASVRNQ